MVSPRASAAWISACRARVRAARPVSGGGAACSRRGPGFGLRGWFLQAGAVAGDGPLDGFGQVVPQMPPIRHLDGQRRALRSAFGVAAAAVPADDLCAGVGVQPGAEGLRGPLRKHVDRPAGLDIDQHGAVDMPLAQREVIDAQHQRSPAIRVRGGADQPHQRRPAHRARQPAGKPGASPAAQGHGDRLQHPLQAACPPAIAGGQARHLLGERRLRAPAVAAEEPAGPQVNEHFLAAAGGIGQPPLVTAVHPPRHHAAARAGRLAGTGPGQHMHRPARRVNTLDGQPGQVRDQNSENLKIARPA